MNHTITTTVIVTTERVADLLCCALEGGSTYWCEAFRPASYPEGAEYGHEAVAQGVPFKVKPDDEAWLEIDNSPERITATLQRLATELPRHWEDFAQENEDAITGDLFFQLLVFGEIVYG